MSDEGRALGARLAELRKWVRGCRGDAFVAIAPRVVDALREAELALLVAENEAIQNAKDMMAHEQRALAQAGVTDLARYEQDSGLEVPKP